MLSFLHAHAATFFCDYFHQTRCFCVSVFGERCSIIRKVARLANGFAKVVGIHNDPEML